MPKVYDSIDFDFSWDGDILLGEDNDIKDTSDNLLKSFQNEIFSIVKSDLTDWRDDPSVGASLGDFIGESNTKVTAVAIQNRVTASLALVVDTGDLNVRVIPVGNSRVLLQINIQVQATPGNGLKANGNITVSFIYDYFERGIFVPLEDMDKFGGRTI